MTCECHPSLVTNSKRNNGQGLLRADPTKTGMIRQVFMADMTRRFRKFKIAVRDFLLIKDVLGLKERKSFITNVEPRQFEFATDAGKLKAFNDWVDQQIKENVLSITLEGYVASAYKRGLLNSYITAKATDPELFSDNGQQSQEAFLQSAFNSPEAISKVQFLATRTYEQLKGVTSQMAADMNRILSQGMLDGSSVIQISKELESKIDTLTATRAMAIARTETVAAHAEGQLDAFDRLGVKDLGVKAEWLTAGDLRVCFPAWTKVETSQGPIPIQFISPGMLVKTRKGFSQVLATSRRSYVGPLVRVFVEGSSIVSSPEHPYWTKRGWVQAEDLLEGDSLQTVENKFVEVQTVVHFNIGDSNNSKSSLCEVIGLLCIPRLVPVPINSVNLQSSVRRSEKEINRISANSGLLNEANTYSRKRFSDSLFRNCFRPRSSVTGKGTKLMVCVSWLFPKFCSASETFLKHWRPATFFRAIMPSWFMFRAVKKQAAAPFAGNVDPSIRSGFTLNRAVSHPCIKRWKCLEFLFTPFADLFDSLRLGRQITTSRTVDPVQIGGGSIHQDSALSARNGFSWFVLWSKVWHVFRDLNVFYRRMSSKEIFVYDMEVKDAPEFFADNILVHNCPLCSANEGKIFSVDEARGMIPLHVNCRCAWIPYIPTTP